MQIQINTGRNIAGHERVESHYAGELEKSFHRFEERISRVEVHFSDENSAKSGVDDKKCVIEVRMAGANPIVGSSFGGSQEKAFWGAVDKVTKMLSSAFEKARDH